MIEQIDTLGGDVANAFRMGAIAMWHEADGVHIARTALACIADEPWSRPDIATGLRRRKKPRLLGIKILTNCDVDARIRLHVALATLEAKFKSHQ